MLVGISIGYGWTKDLNSRKDYGSTPKTFILSLRPTQNLVQWIQG
jgi:hypothetical protein